MSLPNVSFTITNGNLGKIGFNNSGISGFVIYNDNIGDLSQFSTTNRIILFTNLDDIEATGISANSTNFQMEYYQLAEYFRMGGGKIWIGVFADTAGAYTFDEFTLMQNKAKGEIRQFATMIYDDFVTTDIATLNAVMDSMWISKKPAIALLGANYKSITLNTLPDLRNLSTDSPRVSVVLGQDTSGYPTNDTVNSIPDVGAVLGAVSNAKVSENILWVDKFNYYTINRNLLIPGVRVNDGSVDSALLSIDDINESTLDALNDKGYIFWRYLSNKSGTYLSNDHNCDSLTSDYKSIHLNRTIGKAIRDVDEALSVFIGSPISTVGGAMTAGAVKKFKSASEDVLNVMVTNGELSDFDVFIDPTQDVAGTNTVIVELNLVPLFSSDYITVKIGFSTSV